MYDSSASGRDPRPDYSASAMEYGSSTLPDHRYYYPAFPVDLGQGATQGIWSSSHSAGHGQMMYPSSVGQLGSSTHDIQLQGPHPSHHRWDSMVGEEQNSPEMEQMTRLTLGGPYMAHTTGDSGHRGHQQDWRPDGVFESMRASQPSSELSTTGNDGSYDHHEDNGSDGDDEDVDVDDQVEAQAPPADGPTSEDIGEAVKRVLLRAWREKKLRADDVSSAPDLAAQISEIKINNPGRERIIAGRTTRFLERKTFLQNPAYYKMFKKWNTIYTNNIKSLKLKYDRRGLYQDPEERRSALLRDFRQVHPPWSSILRPACKEEEKELFEQEKEVWKDFFQRVLGPALQSGKEMDLSLIEEESRKFRYGTLDEYNTYALILQYTVDFQGVRLEDAVELEQKRLAEEDVKQGRTSYRRVKLLRPREMF